MRKEIRYGILKLDSMRNFYLWIKAFFPAILLLMIGLIGLIGTVEGFTSNGNEIFFATPIAVDDVFSTEEGVAFSGNLLTNDYDENGESLNVTVVPFPAPTNGSLFLASSGVFSYTPNVGFTGVDNFGYRVCNSSNECIIAYATIYVWPAGCTPTEEVYAVDGCGICTTVCIDIPLANVENNFEITEDGTTYNGELTGCDFGDTNAYSYSNLLGQGNSGPYDMTSWNVDGTDYTGSFNTPQELVDLMNLNNPIGEWFLDPNQSLIYGGSSGSTYANMMVQNSDNSSSELIVATENIALGTAVCLTEGNYALAFNPLDGSCPDLIADITVSCLITPPVLLNDDYTIFENTDATGNVLDNDNDPLGGLLSVNITLVIEPTNGTVIQNTNGTFVYTPNTDFVGIDSYTYEACNPDACDEAIVTITVESSNNAPIAVDDDYTIDEGTVYMNNVFINDTEPDADNFTISLVSIPTNGVIQLSADGNFTYAPSGGFVGEDSFDYNLCDEDGLCSQATVTFTVLAVNNPPLALDDTYDILKGETLDANVLDNDTDSENDILSVTTTTISGPQMGIVTLFSDGIFNYISPPTFVGVDQFVYEVCDDAGNCVQATVSINITEPNDAPIAVDDNFAAASDVLFSDNVTSNDIDESMSTLSTTIISQPTNGTINMNTDGTFTYMPLAGFIGMDQFTYEICDEQGACDQATVYITVTADCTNDVGTFTSESCDDCVYVCMDIPYGLIADYELTIDGQPYTDNILACNLNTIIAYTYYTLLGQGTQGPYELLSWVVDGVTYTGTFADPQGLVDLMNSLNPEGNWQLFPAGFGINGGDVESNYSVMDVQNLAGNASFSEIGFNAGPLVSGSAVCVGQGNHVVEATLIGEDCPTIEINANINCLGNLPPVAIDDFFTTDMDVNVNNTVISNDSDPNGDNITVNTNLIAGPSNGIVMIGGSGIFNYIPNPGFIGVDMFTYEICDGSGLCSQAVVTITVAAPVNNPPVAMDDAYSTNVDIPVMDDVMVNDSDPDGDMITANTTLVNLPTNGTVVLNADGTFEYTPNAGYIGVDMFTYEICDDEGLCDIAVVTITILASSCVPAEILNVSEVNASCGGVDNGMITVTISDNPADYIFAWTGSAGTVSADGTQLSGLSQGTYGVTITNITDPTCSVIQDNIVISEGNIDVTLIDINPATCTSADGIASFMPTSYTYTWEDGMVASDRNDLLVGIYFVTVTDVNLPGCEIVLSVDVLENNPLIADANIIAQPYCGYENGEVNIIATGGTDNYAYAWSDGSIDMTRNNLVAGVYGITVTDNNTGCEAITSVTLAGNGDCNDTITVYIPQALVFDTCLTSLFDLPGTITTANVCLDDASTVLATVNQDDMCITLDPEDSFIGVDAVCIYHCNEFGFCDTTIVIIEVESNCVQDFLGIENNVLIDADSCAGVAEFCLPVPFGEYQNYLVTDNGTTIVDVSTGCDIDEIVTYNYEALIGGGNLGPYFLEPWAVNGEPFSGEFQTMQELVDSMNVWNPTGNWELNEAAGLIIGVGTGIKFGDMNITHIQTNNTSGIGFSVGEYSNSTFIELAVGFHEVIVTELTSGCTDTMIVEVYCIMDNILYDTILVNEDGSTCFNLTTNLPGNIDMTSITNTCSELSGLEVLFDVITTDGTEVCMAYSGLNIGVDSACITICDDLGICETTTVVVMVYSEDELINVTDTLYVGDMEVVCPEDFVYFSDFDTVMNVCPELSENVNFEIDLATGCIMYTAATIGTDTACIVYCDPTGLVCDTAYVYVTVLDTTTVISPIAVNDMDTTLQGIPILVDVVLNDTLNGNLESIFVIENPENGTAMTMGDSIILYTPYTDFCGQDSFMYMICNGMTCDSATAYIEVECTDFAIHTAMSPNGDGVNDFFTISGIAEYEVVSLSIFNRWGNKVFEMNDERYMNIAGDGGKGPWDGTWNGKELPDGTYFYCLELPDGLGLRSGYIQLRR